jgi:hypothetical protein
MSKPKKLVLDDGGYFRQGFDITIAGLGFFTFVFGLALFMTDATLVGLLLPCGVLGSGLFLWTAINVTIGLVHQSRDRLAVNQLFEDEILACWRFEAAEWKKVVRAEAKEMVPKDDIPDYMGAVYSSIAGFIIAVILVVVGKFVIREPEAMPIIWACAVGVFLLMFGVGAYQPIKQRIKARRYARKALRVAAPRIWFTHNGVYHETLGYTELSNVVKITDQTRSRDAITFTFSVPDGDKGSGHKQRVSFKVPSDCIEQARQLVRRYRRDCLWD